MHAVEAPRPPVLAAGFASLVVLIGLNIVAVRVIAQEMPPLWAAAARFAVVGVILWVVLWARRAAVPRAGALGAAVLYGALEVGLFFGLGYWGLAAVPASLGAVILASAPLVTILLAAAFRVERLTPWAVVGAALAVAGIYLLEGARVVQGIPWLRLLALGGAAVAASGAAVAVRGLPRASPLATNAVGMAVGAGVLAVWSLAAGETWALPGTRRAWVAMLFLITSSLALFPLFVWIIHSWSAAGAAYAAVLAPLVSVPVAALVLDEAVGARFVVAGAVLLAGVYIGALRRRSAQPP